MSNASDDVRMPVFISRFLSLSESAMSQFMEQISELDGVLVIPVWKPGIAGTGPGLSFRPDVDPELVVNVTQAIGNAAPIAVSQILDRLIQESNAATQEQHNGKER